MRPPLFRWIREHIKWGTRIGCLVAVSPDKIGFALVSTKKQWKQIPCKHCDGTGVTLGESTPCPQCKGERHTLQLIREIPNREELLKYALPRAEKGYAASYFLLQELRKRAGHPLSNPVAFRLMLVQDALPGFLHRSSLYFSKPEIIDITMEEAREEAAKSPGDLDIPGHAADIGG